MFSCSARHVFHRTTSFAGLLPHSPPSMFSSISSSVRGIFVSYCSLASRLILIREDKHSTYSQLGNNKQGDDRPQMFLSIAIIAILGSFVPDSAFEYFQRL